MIKKLFLKLLLKALNDPKVKESIIKIIANAVETRSRRLHIAIRSL
jgi:hypothetical protein